MVKITKEAALLYHSQGKPGKIEVVPTKPYSTQTDLSLAYSPGVAEPCLEIEKDPQTAYDYTAKGNLVAVISNGTAVLGLGDIGALSGKPVMEGKGLLFKIYAGIDVFDIEVNEKDPEKFIQAVKAIAPTFGGINLEDIKAPECFEIENRLKAELDIPVMHDDQHGTAIISSAGLLNALEVAGKKIENVRIVVNGAGASATSCTKLYVALGARKENILMLDSKGVITSDRPNLTESKKFFATDRRDVHTLEEAIKGADVFLGLSKGNVLTHLSAGRRSRGRLWSRCGNTAAHQTLNFFLAQLPACAGGGLRLCGLCGWGGIRLCFPGVLNAHPKASQQLPGQLHGHDIDKLTLEDALYFQDKVHRHQHPGFAVEALPFDLLQIIQRERLGR